MLLVKSRLRYLYYSGGDNVYCDEVVVYKYAMDKGKGPAQMEKLQKGRDSPAHGASEESEEPSSTERFHLERQMSIDEINSGPPIDDVTEPSKL